MDNQQMTNEELYPLYLEFLKGFRETHRSKKYQYVPLSFEVFNFTLKEWNKTLEQSERDVVFERWQKGWYSLTRQQKNCITLWKYHRCVRPG